MNFGRDNFVETVYQDISDPRYPKLITLVGKREIVNGTSTMIYRIYLKYLPAAEKHHHPDLQQITEETYEVIPGSLLFDLFQKVTNSSPKAIHFNELLAKSRASNQ